MFLKGDHVFKRAIMFFKSGDHKGRPYTVTALLNVKTCIQRIFDLQGICVKMASTRVAPYKATALQNVKNLFTVNLRFKDA